MPTAPVPAPTSDPSIRISPGTPDPTVIQTPASHPTSAFALNNATYDVLNLMNTTQLRTFIIDDHPYTNTVSGVTTPSVSLFSSFNSSPFTF